MGIQAERVFNMRLVAAYMCEWNLAAKGGFCKEFSHQKKKGAFLMIFDDNSRIIFVKSSLKPMLWVLIRIAWARRF